MTLAHGERLIDSRLFKRLVAVRFPLAATAIVLAVLWIAESFEPKAKLLFTLSVKAKDPSALRPKLESLLGQSRLQFELRSSTEENLTYEVRMPLDRKVDRLSNGILKLAPETVIPVKGEAYRALGRITLFSLLGGFIGFLLLLPLFALVLR